jgi:hypothetical protein
MQVNSDLHDKKDILRTYADQQTIANQRRNVRRNVIGSVAMPDTSETAGLEAQIEALIRKASDCLRRQLDEVRRNTETAHDQPQELKEAS